MNKTIDFEMNICAKCNGKCCHEGVYVTKKEYEQLEDKYKDIFDCEKFMNGLLTEEDVKSILNNEYQL